jgi:carboxyl-terminal processing protease
MPASLVTSTTPEHINTSAKIRPFEASGNTTRERQKLGATRRSRAFRFGLGVLAAVFALQADRDARATTERENPYSLLDQLGRVLAFVENEYVDPVSHQTLLEGALEGMVAKLDPHSSYLAPEDYGIFQSDTEGRFGGVGVEVDFGEDWVTVIAPIEGSPAERAGVRPGDRIVAIDHLSVRGKRPAELVRQMRGTPGGKVLLTVSRPGSDKYLYFSLTREVISVASVASKALALGVFYLRIKAFQSGTHSELISEFAALRKKANGSPAGLILDLRNNPGGLVNEATAVADEFLTQGVVFTTRRRGKVVDEVRAMPGGALRQGKLVILVNEYTASSAELLSAALQDNRRGSVVGAPTFGKGSVQTIVDLPGGAGLRLTTLRYYTPLGHAIQAEGVKPDVLVPSAGGEFGVVREKNLEGHLSAEPGGPRETPTVSLDPNERPASGAQDATPPNVTPPSSTQQVPTDPRTGTDPALAIAFQMVTGALSTPAEPAQKK